MLLQEMISETNELMDQFEAMNPALEANLLDMVGILCQAIEEAQIELPGDDLEEDLYLLAEMVDANAVELGSELTEIFKILAKSAGFHPAGKRVTKVATKAEAVQFKTQTKAKGYMKGLAAPLKRAALWVKGQEAAAAKHAPAPVTDPVAQAKGVKAAYKKLKGMGAVLQAGEISAK
jgi:hypothetical protein